MSEERTTDAGNLPDAELELNDEYDEPEVGDELDAGEEPESGDEPQLDDQPPEQPRQRRDRGRRERQAAEIRELRERVERQERDLAQARQQPPPQRIDPYEQARQQQLEREQVSMLPPDQQSLYWANKSEQRVAAALQQQRSEIADTVDRSGWDSRCAADPVRRRFAAQVEQTLAGYPVGTSRPPREMVYKYLLGEEADRQRAAGSDKQRRDAARRVRNQTTQPGAARSDGARERLPANDQSVEAARRRLAGRSLW